MELVAARQDWAGTRVDLRCDPLRESTLVEIGAQLALTCPSCVAAPRLFCMLSPWLTSSCPTMKEIGAEAVLQLQSLEIIEVLEEVVLLFPSDFMQLSSHLMQLDKCHGNRVVATISHWESWIARAPLFFRLKKECFIRFNWATLPTSFL